MKKTLVFVSIIATTACSSAQDNEAKEKNGKTPDAVTTAFEKKYPAIKDVDWEKEDVNQFEAEFEINEVEYSAVFDKSGKFMEEEMEIKVADLPNSIVDYVGKNYPGKKIKEAAKITLANGTTNYEAQVGGKDLIFDSNGQFIR